MNAMKTIAGAALMVAMGTVGLAQAGTVVQAAEFGRDGAPRVTVTGKVANDAVHAQAFGRESPGARLLTRGATRPDQVRNSVVPERFGRS